MSRTSFQSAYGCFPGFSGLDGFPYRLRDPAFSRHEEDDHRLNDQIDLRRAADQFDPRVKKDGDDEYMIEFNDLGRSLLQHAADEVEYNTALGVNNIIITVRSRKQL